MLLPGYTHLQRAQPISLAHYFLAQIEALERDHGRILDCAKRADVLPLGSGAIAGSTIVLDRELIARELGFSKLSQNSLDAVGDRDFAAEFLFGLAMIGMHLSRLSEDLILWSTAEFGFITFSDAFSTGSSLMPQKKNPDMAELTRGKTGRLYGNLLALLTTLKGLPTSYNRDLQEDKAPLFDSVNTVKEALQCFAAMLPEIAVNAARMEAAASDPNLLATDLAEYLVKKGMPFREAHDAVGKLVARAAAAKLALNNVSLFQMQEISRLFEEDVLKVFDVRGSLAKRTAVGRAVARKCQRPDRALEKSSVGGSAAPPAMPKQMRLRRQINIERRSARSTYRTDSLFAALPIIFPRERQRPCLRTGWLGNHLERNAFSRQESRGRHRKSAESRARRTAHVDGRAAKTRGGHRGDHRGGEADPDQAGAHPDPRCHLGSPGRPDRRRGGGRGRDRGGGPPRVTGRDRVRAG